MIIETLEQLAAFAIKSANEGTSEDAQITCYEDLDGIAYVAGEPAPGGHRVSRVRRSVIATPCQRCKELHVAMELVLLVR
ncbi:MAG TPA: hypothetical protein VK509_20730, partial [Polyangiales bacterium]|nr:hypothetical protein [Polyangiales bacterium]